MEIMEKIRINYKNEKDKKLETSDELKNVISLLRKLKNKDLIIQDAQEYKQASFQAYKKLTEFFINNNAEFITDVNQIYRKYGNNFSFPFVTRREDPEKVASLCEGHNVSLAFDPNVVGDRGDKYANCAIWPHGKDPIGGIRNSFLEGRGMAGPIVTLVALKQNPKNNSLEITKDSLQKVGTIEREAVRIVSGQIKKEDLAFIILRIQKEFFPPENLTEEEEKNNNKQIFRGFTFE